MGQYVNPIVIGLFLPRQLQADVDVFDAGELPHYSVVGVDRGKAVNPEKHDIELAPLFIVEEFRPDVRHGIDPKGIEDAVDGFCKILEGRIVLVSLDVHDQYEDPAIKVPVEEA